LQDTRFFSGRLWDEFAAFLFIIKNMLRLLFLALLFAMTTATFSQQPPIETGVPKTLAEWRAKHYSNIRYELNLTLEKGAPLMKGAIEISVNLDEEGKQNDLSLDWRTTQFENDKDKPFAEVISVNKSIVKETPGTGVFDYSLTKEHILISKKYLKTGENTIKIKFASPIKTSGSAITRYIDKEDNSEYIYSLFVPSDASTAFPVFDQPDLKARFSLSVTVPRDWKVISNTKGNIRDSFTMRSYNENGKSGDVIRQSFDKVEFVETKPISTYVFAFAVGDFEVFQDYSAQIVSEKNGIREIDKSITTPKIYVRKSQAEKFKPHAQEVFRLNRECVKYLEDYFDYKFPFPKYDLVLIPEFPFGGMEHAGATFLKENSIIFPSEPTKNDLISRATLIFHETAHQWFGDTVTMKWFDDLWLKEGFATFMGFKALDKIMPEMNAWKAFYERNKVAAYQTDSTKGTTPIYQEIPNLSAAKSAYGNIVYSKAPSFLKQAEFYLGEKEFQTAVRSFLKKHEFSNATWQDLVTEFEIAGKYKKDELKKWAEKWVTEPGLPIIRMSKDKEGNLSKYLIHGKFNYSYLQINDRNPQNDWGMRTRILVIHDNGDKDNAKSSNLGEPHTLDSLDTFPNDILIPLNWRVECIYLNYQDYGYGIFLLDEKSRNYILANVQNEKDDFLRAMMYGSLWDSVREAELNPKEYVELVIKNVAAEKDETIVSSMLGRANTAMNYYLDDKMRESLTPKLEEILISKMQSAETLGQRITFYRSFLNVASSEKGREVLKQILDSRFKIQGFNLKTKDKFDIVTKLFILGDKDAERLLTELSKTETSDDAKRYAYAARAGIGNAETKAKYGMISSTIKKSAKAGSKRRLVHSIRSDIQI
jgi:aminopeptidase N